ncbi:T9SS type A sorting domain-containing protein, partial [bacterium]|nr:T9SS type A sorting domain-containing protein [bacterium]
YTGGLLIPEGTEPDGVYISACMSKDATGTVWFDNIRCGSDPWSMGVFNGDIETPKGWMAWSSSSDTGFANTVQDEALSGEWSAKLEELDEKGDEMVFYSAPAPAQAGQWYLVGVSAKTVGMNTNPNYIPSNICQTRVDDWANLCFFFHTGLETSWSLTPPGDLFMYFNQVDAASDWTRYRVAIKAPAEEVQGVSVRARFNPQTMGTVYFDDFCVRPFNINETAIQEEIVNLNVKPESYAVLRNYPNPFNPETTMEYTIPENSLVELAVYNMLGQKIRTMINDFRPAGNYRAVWDGRDNFGMTVPSGVYIARMTGNGFSINTKMLLIK